jgi:hypothetical protein
MSWCAPICWYSLESDSGLAAYLAQVPAVAPYLHESFYGILSPVAWHPTSAASNTLLETGLANLASVHLFLQRACRQTLHLQPPKKPLMDTILHTSDSTTMHHCQGAPNLDKQPPHNKLPLGG